jgi:hypothetical protein
MTESVSTVYVYPASVERYTAGCTMYKRDGKDHTKWDVLVLAVRSVCRVSECYYSNEVCVFKSWSHHQFAVSCNLIQLCIKYTYILLPRSLKDKYYCNSLCTCLSVYPSIRLSCYPSLVYLTALSIAHII